MEHGDWIQCMLSKSLKSRGSQLDTPCVKKYIVMDNTYLYSRALLSPGPCVQVLLVTLYRARYSDHPHVSLHFTVNRSCQEQSSLSLNLWSMGGVTVDDSVQGRVYWKFLCRNDSAAIVWASSMVGLARACATEVDPAPLLPLVQARTAFGDGTSSLPSPSNRVPDPWSASAFLSLLHRPHPFEPLETCPQTTRRGRFASPPQISGPGRQTIVLYRLGRALAQRAVWLLSTTTACHRRKPFRQPGSISLR